MRWRMLRTNPRTGISKASVQCWRGTHLSPLRRPTGRNFWPEQDLLVNDDQPRAATAGLQAPIKLQVVTMLRTVTRNDMKGGIAIAAHVVSKRDAGKRQGTQ
jgi:hypothetical protein